MITTILAIVLTDARPQTHKAQSGYRIVRWLRPGLPGLLVLIVGLLLTGRKCEDSGQCLAEMLFIEYAYPDRTTFSLIGEHQHYPGKATQSDP